MKAISPVEYRKKRRKYVEIPVEGGESDVFLIQQMDAETFASFIDLFGVSIESLETRAAAVDQAVEQVKGKKVDREMFLKMIDCVFPRCVVEPKIVPGTSDSEDTLGAHELTDPGTLLDAIFEFSGLSEKNTERRESFPRNNSG